MTSDVVSDLVLTSEERKLLVDAVLASSEESLVGYAFNTENSLDVCRLVADGELSNMPKEDEEGISSSETGAFNEPSELEEVMSSGVVFSKVEIEATDEIVSI